MTLIHTPNRSENRFPIFFSFPKSSEVFDKNPLSSSQGLDYFCAFLAISGDEKLESTILSSKFISQYYNYFTFISVPVNY